MVVTLQQATQSDLQQLAAFNRELSQDEQQDDPFPEDQIEDRMSVFLDKYHAYLFHSPEFPDSPVGYCLIRPGDRAYLRQFFVARFARRKGIGHAAFQKLRILYPQPIDVEVLRWNNPALCFWKDLGFMERTVGLRL